jgi:hypothetical protein
MGSISGAADWRAADWRAEQLGLVYFPTYGVVLTFVIMVFRLARQEHHVWVIWPARVAALMAAQVAAEVEKQSG